MKLKTEVTGDDVDEAHYLFEISTMKTIEDKSFGAALTIATREELERIEEVIKKRVPIGNEVMVQNLISNLSDKFDAHQVNQAIEIMQRNGEMKAIKGGKNLIRERW